MSNHYMRSNMYGSLKMPVAMKPARLSHEEEDPFRHILTAEEEYPQNRFQPARQSKSVYCPAPQKRKEKKKDENLPLSVDRPPRPQPQPQPPPPPPPPLTHHIVRPTSTVSSRTPTTPSKNLTTRSLNLLTSKAKTFFSQLSNSHSHPHQPHPDRLVDKTIHYIRHGNYIPEYVPIDAPQPVAVPRRDRDRDRAIARSSVYSSHCLVSGSATRRGSRYFQI